MKAGYFLGLFLGILVGSGGGALGGERLGEKGMREAAEYSRARGGKSLLVIQGGRVIFEEYGDGVKAGEVQKIYSGTKGFWTVAAMCAVEEGRMRLGERVAETITEWSGDRRRARITIGELLNFTDGIEALNHVHSDAVEDRNGYALGAKVVAKPGEAFIYGGSHLQIFGEVLKRKLAKDGETPMGYLRRKVLDPLGLGGVMYQADRMGNPLMASGFRLSARQWSRMGELILRRGEYGGRRVVGGNFLGKCFVGSGACPLFGMGFWNNAMAGRGDAREIDIEGMLERKWEDADWERGCMGRGLPVDLVASIGSEYQRLVVIPSADLIVVRQGKGGRFRFSDGDFLRILLGVKG